MLSWLPASNGSIITAMLVASVLPLFFAMFAKIVAGFKPKDNENPRDFLSKTTGLASRANAVQQNSFETLPIFLASVIVALLYFVPIEVVNKLAWLYVFLRILFGIAYLANWATFRSVVWVLGFICPILLFMLAIRFS